jgi:hypothetical protein
MYARFTVSLLISKPTGGVTTIHEKKQSPRLLLPPPPPSSRRASTTDNQQPTPTTLGAAESLLSPANFSQPLNNNKNPPADCNKMRNHFAQ